MNNQIIKELSELNLPHNVLNDAIVCFEDVDDIYNQNVRPYVLFAPFAVAWIVQKLPWKAEHLRTPGFPKWWYKYDNNVTVNGDKAMWLADPVTGVGVMQPCPLEDNEEARSYCYYAKGHHPRSKWARWIWMGIRNRASALAGDFGIDVTNIHEVKTWGDTSISRSREGVCLYKYGNYYQLISYKKWWKFCIRRNYGYKISNAVTFGERAAITKIGFSLLGWIDKK